MNKYESIIIITSGWVDFKGRLKISSLFSAFQEIAYNHAVILKFGYDDLSKLNLYWVLSKMKIVIDRMPVWNETCRFVTWPRKPDAVTAYRDFEVIDAKGKQIIRATSSWAIISSDNLKPQRISVLGLELDFNEETVFNNPRIDKIPQSDRINYSYTRDIRYSDIDVNNHTNNTRYIEFIADGLPDTVDRSADITEVIIHFISESRINDKINISYNTSLPERVLVDGVDGDNTVFRCLITF